MIKTLISSTILSLALTTSVSAATQLRFAEGSPNRGARADAVNHFMEDVTQLSGGDLSFDTHWAGALLNYKSMVQGVAGGTADMGTMLAAYNPQKLRSLTIGDVPTPYSDPWVGMRAVGNFAKILDDLGANLVNLNIGDAYQAYDTGLVDCGASYF
ncbi:hypothetical protein [Marinobacter litoralis]|uniref:hypothetical protein n=1 Tax=Marinobacter litoralis TaxID=187981 RepID=UPI0018EA3807|nr:hypothetical protein [Marinobacter litoralis]MBJ6136079.1 hypothetical protein [Marinobacter litoralis]